jgi:hypothetical protein
MSSAVLAIAATFAVHILGPVILQEAPALLSLPEAREEVVFLRELEVYRHAASKYRTASQAQLIVHAPAHVADLLPPLWSCRTRFECDLSIALIKSEIHRGQQ